MPTRYARSLTTVCSWEEREGGWGRGQVEGWRGEISQNSSPVCSWDISPFHLLLTVLSLQPVCLSCFPPVYVCKGVLDNLGMRLCDRMFWSVWACTTVKTKLHLPVCCISIKAFLFYLPSCLLFFFFRSYFIPLPPISEIHLLNWFVNLLTSEILQ